MAYTKYDVNPANNINPPPDGAPEGMLPSDVNDTMRDMMAQIRILGDSINDGSLPGADTPIPIENGGTGGITAVLARTNLEVYSKTESDANYLVAIPARILTSETGPTDALPGAVMPHSFVNRDTVGMYSPLAGTVALSAGDHTKRLQLSQIVLDVGVPINVVNLGDKEISRVNQDVYSRNQVEMLIANLEPIGTVKQWVGTLATIPVGFKVADGTNGTINMVDKFSRGTNLDVGIGVTGGDDAQTVTFGNMLNAGIHNHSGDTEGHALSVAELAPHEHDEIINNTLSQQTSGTNQGNILMSSPISADTGTTGSGLPHQHGISTDPGHAHGGSQVLDNRPNFIQVMWIQKTSIVLVSG